MFVVMIGLDHADDVDDYDDADEVLVVMMVTATASLLLTSEQSR